MDPQDLRWTYAHVRLQFPELDKFTGNKLQQFYADIVAQHPFEIFVQDGDSGADLETEGRRSLQIRRSTIFLDETVSDTVEVVSKNWTHLLDVTQTTFEIPLFIVNLVTIRALWPTNEEDVTEKLRTRLISLTDDELDVLGNVQGVGVTFAGHTGEDPDDLPHYDWSVEIAPHLQEPSEIWLELENRPFPPVAEDAEKVVDTLQQTYSLLTDNVTKFVKQLM